MEWWGGVGGGNFGCSGGDVEGFLNKYRVSNH